MGISSPVYAQRSGPVLIGSHQPDGRLDHDTIRVNKAQGNWRAIQFRIQGGAITFQRVIVRFENGQTQELQVADVIPAGGRTRIIDLAGDFSRTIKTIDVWYGAPNWRTRPRLLVYGFR